MSLVANELSVLPAGNRKILVAVVASTFGLALDLFDLFVLLFVAPVVN
jgi:MFS transporter, MHS family, proline/betaine transporter